MTSIQPTTTTKKKQKKTLLFLRPAYNQLQIDHGCSQAIIQICLWDGFEGCMCVECVRARVCVRA